MPTYHVGLVKCQIDEVPFAIRPNSTISQNLLLEVENVQENRTIHFDVHDPYGRGLAIIDREFEGRQMG